MGLGRNIRLIRTARGMRASELAQAVKSSPSYISLIETEKRQPSLRLTQKIADELGVPLNLIFWEQGPSSPRVTDTAGERDLLDVLFRMMAEVAREQVGPAGSRGVAYGSAPSKDKKR